MAKKPGAFSRRTFIKSSAATWGVTALAPYMNSLAATPESYSLASEFMSPPVSSRPMVLWAWLNGYVDRDQLTRELEEMRDKGLRGPILWDVASIRDPKETVPAGPAFFGEESLGYFSRQPSKRASASEYSSFSFANVAFVTHQCAGPLPV